MKPTVWYTRTCRSLKETKSIASSGRIYQLRTVRATSHVSSLSRTKQGETYVHHLVQGLGQLRREPHRHAGLARPKAVPLFPIRRQRPPRDYLVQGDTQRKHIALEAVAVEAAAGGARGFQHGTTIVMPGGERALQ